MDYANTTNVEFIVDPGFHAGPGHITKFQDMAKQMNNFKKARHDRMECEKRIEKLDWNTKFYHPAKFELKRIKNAKVVPRMHFFASYICPPCDSILNFIAKSLQPIINVHSSHYADVNCFLNPSIITGENCCPDLLFRSGPRAYMF